MTGELRPHHEAHEQYNAPHEQPGADGGESFTVGEGGQPLPTVLSVSDSHAESQTAGDAPELQQKPLLLTRQHWGWRAETVGPDKAAEALEPLVQSLFTPRSGVQSIGMVDIAHGQHVDPPTGPAVVGLFHSHIPNEMISDFEAPAELIAAQLTNETGLVTVDWHTVAKLGALTGVCGDGTCLRLLYGGGTGIEAQDITGKTIEGFDRTLAFTGLRWALDSLDASGMAYDPHTTATKELAQQVVQTGHQLTIPDAALVSRVLRLPYPTR